MENGFTGLFSIIHNKKVYVYLLFSRNFHQWTVQSTKNYQHCSPFGLRFHQTLTFFIIIRARDFLFNTDYQQILWTQSSAHNMKLCTNFILVYAELKACSKDMTFFLNGSIRYFTVFLGWFHVWGNFYKITFQCPERRQARKHQLLLPIYLLLARLPGQKFSSRSFIACPFSSCCCPIRQVSESMQPPFLPALWKPGQG